MPDPTQPLRLIIQVAAFVLVAALWLAVIILWRLARSRQEERIQSRLGMPGPDGTSAQGKVLRLWHQGGVAETTVTDEDRPTFLQRLEQLRMDAGWKTPMLTILGMLVVGIGLLSAFLLALTGNPLLPGIVAALLLLVFNACLQYSINKRTELFERQLVDALDLGALSLRAGHPLSGAFQLIASEVEEPVGVLFAEICEQEELGMSTQDALGRCAARSRSPDMKIFAASVTIQLRSGGNLADMLERVTWVVRERMRLSRRARVLTAEAQLSKWVLLALPIGMFLVLNVMNPAYMRPMYTTNIGRVMLAAGAAGLLIGSWIMGRMARLSY